MVVESSGTQAATVGTEHSLAAPTSAKTRVLIVDLGALLNDEEVELRVKRAVLLSGTVRTDIYTFRHIQASPIKESQPYVCPQGAEFTLKQTTGTGRSFPWAVITLD
jgi:hypothetical protein